MTYPAKLKRETPKEQMRREAIESLIERAIEQGRASMLQELKDKIEEIDNMALYYMDDPNMIGMKPIKVIKFPERKWKELKAMLTQNTQHDRKVSSINPAISVETSSGAKAPLDAKQKQGCGKMLKEHCK